jgi:GTP pyrophosphokinase
VSPDQALRDLRLQLGAELAERAPRVDLERMGEAFEFAAQAHASQRRESGEPFLTHLVGVVRVLLELLEGRLDTTVVCAALLHDVVEDTQITPREIQARFGEEVAALVEGVTKLSGLEFDRPESAQAENFRRMMLSMARDLRVIFIKLADRLHNMRTLDYLEAERARRIARETQDIYAPLAHRLGMARIKRELDDLALRALEPQSYREIADEMKARRDEREAFIESLRVELSRALSGAGVQAEVTGRPKHFYSIYQKIQGGRSLAEIYDLYGLRIITRDKDDCYRALGVVHDVYTPMGERFKDYIATPKSNMYQSLHTTVVVPDGRLVEVQIRSHDMHRTAESGVAAHYVYKEGGRVDQELDAKLGGFVSQTADWQRTASDEEYMDFLHTALYQDDVFVFTPNRELKRLPKGGTVIDFAYLVHTAVGHHCTGARVNGEFVPLRYELKSGDTVEVITSSQGRPHEDWLKIVRTAGARSKIRHWLRQQHVADSITLGRDMLERELKRARLTPDEDRLSETAASLGCADLEQLYARIGQGTISVSSVMRHLQPEKESLADRFVKAPLEALGLAKRAQAGIRIQGLDNVMLHFARCCQPVPGDRVVGVVTPGRGVSVHRADCPNTLGDQIPAERLVEVEWDAGPADVFPVRLVVYGHDRTSLLADIARAIATTKVNIRSAGMASEDKTARGVFVVEVPHLQRLREVIGAIRKVTGVSRVERRQRFARRRLGDAGQRRSG